MTLNNTFVWMSLVGVALTAGTPAFAQDPGSCCLQSTSRLDALLNPAKGSDEKFFTSGGGPPNVLMILDTSCSMHDWPQDWPATAGCAHPEIAGLGFDPTATYRSMIKNVSGGTPTFNTNWFDVLKYYDAPQQGYGTNFTGAMINANTGGALGNWASAAAACTSITGSALATCETCLANQGYYVHDANVRRVWGKFLNFYAPRDSGSVLVMSHLINDIRTVRFGIEVFGTSSGNCWGAGGRVCLFEEMGPKCGKSFPLDDSSVDNNRSSIETKLQAKLTYINSTPLAGALYAAGHYFKNKAGTDNFATWFGAGYPTDSDFNENGPADQKTICASCGFNSIILITDGEPYNDNVLTLPAAITGQTGLNCVGGGACSLDLAKVAKWWWEHDMRPDYPGVQKVSTYAIGFSQDANSSSTLKTAAQYGGGKFYGATNTVALRDAVFAILEEINSKNTSFSSAAIASVQSAGSTFAAILPRFSPQSNQPWIGSLRRFNLFNEFVEDLNLNPGELQPDGTADADKTDIWLVDSSMPNGPYPPAVPLATSRVVEDADGQFVLWGASGTGILPDGGTPTPASPYWEAGSMLVTKGAANRKIYTVRDTSLDGAFTSADALTSFTAANSLVIGPYLGILGTSFCPAFVGATVCNGGSKNGLACASVADCPASSACTGGSNAGLACTVVADCPAGSVCVGGPRDGLGCVAAAAGADCPVAGGVCVGGTNAGQGCVLAADCPLGACNAVAGVCGASTVGACTVIPTTCSASGAGSNGDMLTKWGLSISALAATLVPVVAVPANQTALDDLCVKGLIEFIRGQDLADEDGDGNRAETRRSVLGDIFHSSPAVVDPPVDKFLCDIGLHNQCIRTLYSKTLGPTIHTPQDNPGGQTNCSGGPVTRDPYEAWQWMNRKRDKVVLVGANDGMLHAFHDGNATASCVGGTETIDYPAFDAIPTDPGSEAWAFIPPDLLPRLQEHVFGHAYFVDGDIMVRDIWEDANQDGRKTYNEFHTLAVIADGRGGTHYTALEVRFNNSAVAVGTAAADLVLGQTANNIAAPGFRWMFPQPCSDEASLFGKTLLSLAPKPPPIGPVLIERNTILAGKPTAGTNRYTCTGGGVTPCDTSEQWVVMVGGGWSPGLEKGRGVYMVDAWNGKVNGRSDNLLWKMEYDRSVGSDDQKGPLKEMRYSITAPVAMADYGSNTNVQLDGFFDTAAVGDTGGQVWLARFHRPGQIDATTKLIKNWSGGRAFEMDRKGDPNANGDNRDVKNVWPFYYITSVGLQSDTNALRLFTGTGNRYSLLEPSAGTCRFDNPLACAKYDCEEVEVEYKIEKNTLKLDKARMLWKGTDFKGNDAEQNTSVVAAGVCGAPGSTSVTASIKQKVKDCDQQSGGDVDFGDIRKTDVSCGKDATGNFFCRRTDTNPSVVSDLVFTPENSAISALTNNRFFGFWAYGGPDPTRKFEEDQTSTGTWKTALQFDGSRLSDRTSANGTSGDLVDVTSITCTTASSCSGTGAYPSGKGWFYTYTAPLEPAKGLDHRTASGSALLASCVLWNAIFPATASTSCGLAAVATGRFHQADFITGLPNCAAGFKDSSGNFVRSLDRGIQAPPPEPASAIQISKTGQIRYSALLVEPGSKQATEANVTSGGDVLQSVYEIPISRAMHKCRHVPGGSANCVEAPP